MTSTPLQRALAAAPERPIGGQTRPEREFFAFRVGELSLAVPSENVREVTRLGPVTPLPRTPPFILGVFGHRGEVLPAFDLLRFLGKGEMRVGSRSRLFVAISGKFTAAVLTDAVIGLRKVLLADVLPPPLGGEGWSEHLIGVVRIGEGSSLSLIDLPKVLAVARERMVTR
ncbi:MAG: chemotaxis protein CheW [Myxococcaceae bacterium]